MIDELFPNIHLLRTLIIAYIESMEKKAVNKEGDDDVIKWRFIGVDFLWWILVKLKIGKFRGFRLFLVKI